MAISISYQKRKNQNLFAKLKSDKNINLDLVQNYIPIYSKFFSLSNTNWNSIGLNQELSLVSITDTSDADMNIYGCKLKHASNDSTQSKQTFVKLAPLLDPFKYIVGKYDTNSPNLFNLPSFDKNLLVHPKIEDPNNSSYVDAFFSYLTSRTLHVHKFVHGLDFYGSFLGIKSNYVVNVIDEIDYLTQNDFFNKQKGKMFTIQDYSHLLPNSTKIVKPLKISTSAKSVLSVKSIDDNMFEDIFDVGNDNDNNNNCTNIDNFVSSELEDVSLSAIQPLSIESAKSSSTCSSRTSHTNDHDLEDDDSEDAGNEDDEDAGNEGDETAGDNGSGSGSDTEYEDIDDDEDDETMSSCEDEQLLLTLPKFPVQFICMENCKDTLDHLIVERFISGEIPNEQIHEEWFSALIQIIMMLITYQKMFGFTHNDLHTNNIMYVSTNKPYLYYVYKKTTYKVPTFGRIFKLIDFGRAIYRFNGKLFCSDSFQSGGDGSTQYNTEPYFNDKKARIDPNYSFDLCRLACSIFDYVVEDFELTKQPSQCSPIAKLMIDWCIDDNGINVLYKNNGVERYPGFKLYKMIARCVHKHTPMAQLERPEFKAFVSLDNPKGENVMNIDLLPSYVN